jgi:hypothetical protein
MTAHRTLALGVLATSLAAASAFAADAPLTTGLNTGNAQPNTAQLIVAARLAPEVEVDRDLSAQPVHPWLAHVTLGGDADSAAQSTYIDPMRSMDTASRTLRMDSNHSFVKAQRLYRQTQGITTSDLAELSNITQAFAPRAAGANQAQLIRGIDNGRVVYGTRTVPVLDSAAQETHPAPAKPGQPVPIPAVPRLVSPQKGTLASAETFTR